jgi:hypothetical protein
MEAKTKTTKIRPSRFLMPGGKSSKRFHSYQVSIFTHLTLSIEHNGRTVQLLKQGSKPVPKTRKRRKIDIMGTLAEFEAMPEE